MLVRRLDTKGEVGFGSSLLVGLTLEAHLDHTSKCPHRSNLVAPFFKWMTL
jgi:hypothetical protein